MVASFQGVGFDGDDFDAVVEPLAEGDGHAAGDVAVGILCVVRSASVAVNHEDIAVVGAGEFQHALIGYHDGIYLAHGQAGADIHAGTNLFAGIGDVQLGLEGVAGGIDGGIDDLDGGRKDGAGVDVAFHLYLHTLLD